MFESGPGGRQGDLAVGEVADAHVNAEDTERCVIGVRRTVRVIELGDGQGGEQAGYECRFGAAGGQTGRSCKGFELCGFEGGEPC